MINASWVGSALQLSLVTVANPVGPCSSRTGSANGLPTTNEGPIARRRTFLGPLPVMINPPIPTLSLVRTRIRVERLTGCAAPPGVGEGVGVIVGVEVGVGPGVIVPVAVEVAVAVGVDVAVAVAVAVAVGVGEGGTVAV